MDSMRKLKAQAPAALAEPQPDAKRILDACFGDPFVWLEGGDHSDVLSSNEWLLIKAPQLRIEFQAAEQRTTRAALEAAAKVAAQWCQEASDRDDGLPDNVDLQQRILALSAPAQTPSEQVLEVPLKKEK